MEEAPSLAKANKEWRKDGGGQTSSLVVPLLQESWRGLLRGDVGAEEGRWRRERRHVEAAGDVASRTALANMWRQITMR